MSEKRPTLVFDVNETLLDLDSLAPLFAKWFEDGAVMREWFAQLILYSQAITLSDIYAPFPDLAAGVLRMTGRIRGCSVGDDQIADLKAAIGSMPAHPDADHALRRLQDAGFRMVTLTNSATGPSPSPLDRAGLSGFFDAAFSVDSVRGFKPAPQTYAMVEDTLNLPPQRLCMIACHAWDVLGAQACGWQGALVTHGVNAALPVAGVARPDIIADDLSGLAEGLIARL